MITEFQKKVYKIIKKIPKGELMTYKQVAEKLGNKNLARAVGNALNKNYDFKIPCHRVIRSDGKIGGYNRGINKKIIKLNKELGFKFKDKFKFL